MRELERQGGLGFIQTMRDFFTCLEQSYHNNNIRKFNNRSYTFSSGYQQNIIMHCSKRCLYSKVQTYGDLTGSYITSDKKITVMSGNRRTSVLPGTSRDTLVDQVRKVPHMFVYLNKMGCCRSKEKASMKTGCFRR